ncbi:MAG: patatin-like phospholipase family protein [Sphaerochaetaceae bacterium]|nr:patatin-like phospholipase family protein [Sphaerochaetaceae bacterium]
MIAKYSVIILLFLTIVLPLQAAETVSATVAELPVSITTYGFNMAELDLTPKIALVLSGGGARGFAHLPVIRAIEELGIPIDMVVGTSMGALVGGFYAAGYSPGDIARLIETSDMLSLFIVSPVERPQPEPEPLRTSRDNIFTLSFDSQGVGNVSGLLGDQRIMQLLNDSLSKVLAIDDFDRLAIPFRCIASDAVTGEKVVFSSGSLVEAIRGSISIPLIFTPYPTDGRYVIDGGVVDNLPILVAKEAGADIVIAVDVNAGDYDIKTEDLNSLTAMITHLLVVVTKNTVVHQLDQADVLITPDLSKYDIMAFTNASGIIKEGEIAVQEKIEELHQIVRLISEHRPLQKKDPDRVGHYFDLPDVWISTITHRILPGSPEDTYGFDLKPFGKFSGLPLDTKRKSELARIFEQLRRDGRYATVSYGYNARKIDSQQNVLGNLEIQTRSFPPRDAAISFGAFGASGFQWDVHNKSSSLLFDPSATVSFKYNNVGNSVDIFANLAFDDAFHSEVGFEVPSRQSLYSTLSLGFSSGGLHPANLRFSPIDGHNSDNLLSAALAGTYRFSRYAMITAKFQTDIIWYGGDKNQLVQNADQWFVVLPIIKLEGVYNSLNFGHYPMGGFRFDASVWVTLAEEIPMFKFESRLRHVIPLDDRFSWLYDLHAGVNRTRYPLKNQYLEYGGSMGMAGYGPHTYVDEMVLARTGLIWNFAGSTLPFFIKATASIGTSSSSLYERLRNSIPIVDSSLLWSKLRPIEAGVAISVGFTSSFGDLLIGVGFASQSKITLYLEFI